MSMADETVFDFLHSEVVNYVCQESNKDKKVCIIAHNQTNNQQLMFIILFQDEDLSNLEYIGFISGYKIIERQVLTVLLSSDRNFC